MRRASIAAALAIACLAAMSVVAPLASAQGTHGAVDQYTENVPGAGGDRPGGGQGGSGGSQGGGGDQATGPGEGAGGLSGESGGSGSTLPPAVGEQFEQAGADGAAAAALAESTGPRAAGGGTESTVSTGEDDGGTSVGPDGSGGVSNLVDAVVGGSSDSGGTGIVLPLVIGLALIAAVVFVIARRRGHGEPGGA